MTAGAVIGVAGAPSGAELPKIVQLSPRQQMGICCARCGQYLGANGRRWGEARHAVHDRTFVFVLWTCAVPCQPIGPGPHGAVR